MDILHVLDVLPSMDVLHPSKYIQDVLHPAKYIQDVYNIFVLLLLSLFVRYKSSDLFFFIFNSSRDSPSLPRTPNSSLHESAKLPLAIKEKDVEYQFHRTIMFARLLESYPFSRKLIVAESKVDICPLMRGEIWAAILGVKVRLS